MALTLLFTGVFLLFLSPSFSFSTSSENRIKALYHSLDRTSITENLAFYELYPSSEEGKKALKTAWSLMSSATTWQEEEIQVPALDMQSIINLVMQKDTPSTLAMNPAQLAAFDVAARRLHNRTLKGYGCWNIEHMQALASEELDLARALLLHQFSGEEDSKTKILCYEATIDLMAMQILARLPKDPRPGEKIQAINHFLFEEMRFRFPPHSIHVKEIDTYSFIPSVIDSRLGVCLGVSTLYLCLAQRLGLELEIITPPGHIFLSSSEESPRINIETTARGIHMPLEKYLGINTAHLQRRTVKEVIGMAFFNQAPVASRLGNYTKAIELYHLARKYMPDDPLVKMLLGFNYLLAGKKKEATFWIRQVAGKAFDGELIPETMAEDFLSNKVDGKGIELVFLPVDENRESIKDKLAKLELYLKKHPKFRAGILQKAICQLQLSLKQKAIATLLEYHRQDPSNPTVEYYLTILYLQAKDHKSSWQFFRNLSEILTSKNHHPQAYKELKRTLISVCPIP